MGQAIENKCETSGSIGIAGTYNSTLEGGYSQLILGASGTSNGNEFSFSTHNDIIPPNTDEAWSGGLSFALNAGEQKRWEFSQETYTAGRSAGEAKRGKGATYTQTPLHQAVNRTDTKLSYKDRESGAGVALTYTGGNTLQTLIHAGGNLPNQEMHQRGAGVELIIPNNPEAIGGEED